MQLETNPRTKKKNTPHASQSPFENWDNISWIRSRPIRQGEISGLPFSPDLMPLASHPAIASDSERWLQVLAYKLLGYLKFTTLLELNYVNPITAALAAGRAPFKVTAQQRSDALRVYCDEAGHALFTEELTTQVQKKFGLHQSMLGRPRMELVLEKILEENKTELSPHLIKLFFVAISETLISRYLNSLPHDEKVDPLVRQVVADHADDEVRHNIYYRNIFPILWDSLTCYEKEEVGKLLPKLVCAFLGPDKDFEYRVLRQIGFKQADAKGILEETYIPSEVAKSVKNAAAPTLKMFRDAGIFNIAAVEQVFADYDYI
ncbi:P-aminobenzoate N-oxygenase AurF [Rivularia sp. PCC 7116]|uniref:diiron oxygenase n=1 Tax=Rivularia sp. PCC 7116 TaxID=373994 RepID=UPI00029ED167|nr:diiron oxygenase [Rivularia sp. PCC 7116]AFY57187.1 P-aminobenzoate N-oxygenase AurF [Rivularia sp. PCC 7116]